MLLSREAALRPAARYYQRLLARDRHEAEAVVKEYLADHPVEDLFDRVLVPALVLVRRGRKAGELRPEDEEFILRTTREIVAGLASSAIADLDVDTKVVLGVAAVDAVDEAALDMLRHLARAGGVNIVAGCARGGPGRCVDRGGRAGRIDRGWLFMPATSQSTSWRESRRRQVGPGTGSQEGPRGTHGSWGRPSRGNAPRGARLLDSAESLDAYHIHIGRACALKRHI